MRIREILSEASLTPSQLVKHQGLYLINLIRKIESGVPLPVSGKYQEKYGKSIKLTRQSAQSLKDYFFPEGNPDLAKISASGNLIIPDKSEKLSLVTKTGINIPLGALEKTPDIKGKDIDFNLGDIGEIAIAISVYAKFLLKGKEITLDDFYSVARTLKIGHNKSGSSGNALSSGTVKWPIGKQDTVTLKAVLPRRSMDYIATDTFLSGKASEPHVIGTIKSAIDFANKSQKVAGGIAMVSKNPETNDIRITCDGVSDQKGTKADIIMDIDGEPINIVSAKVGRSQLGQASGHMFNKQIMFFNTVFGVDVRKYEKLWGTSLEDHLKAFQAMWDDVNSKVSAAFAGDVTSKEIPMVKQLANGLIKYSNTSKPGDVDIVKLISSSSRPGFKLLRIDEKLYEALEKTDLIAHIGNNGVSIYGTYNNKKILLMKARSYKSGTTVRTVIEGGDLLDILAEVTE